jgi:hypothetical protein
MTSDIRFDDELRSSNKTRTILKRLRKEGAYRSNRLSPEHVLDLELVDRAGGCMKVANLEWLAAKLVDRYGSAEQVIELLRSEKVRFEEVSSESGADDTGLRITLLDPDENDALLVFFVDTEDDESLVDFLDLYGVQSSLEWPEAV